MGWFSTITGDVIGKVTTAVMAPINTWQERKKAIAEAKQKQILAEYEFKTKRILNTDVANSQWEIDALKVTKRSPMQWITLTVLGAPFVIAWFNPQLVADYFTVSIQVVPLWYVQLFVSIVGVIWGIAQVKNVAQGIRASLLDSRKTKHEQALEMAKVVSQVVNPQEEEED